MAYLGGGAVVCVYRSRQRCLQPVLQLHIARNKEIPVPRQHVTGTDKRWFTCQWLDRGLESACVNVARDHDAIQPASDGLGSHICAHVHMSCVGMHVCVCVLICEDVRMYDLCACCDHMPVSV